MTDEDLGIDWFQHLDGQVPYEGAVGAMVRLLREAIAWTGHYDKYYTAWLSEARALVGEPATRD